MKERGFLFDSNYSIEVNKEKNVLHCSISKKRNILDSFLYGNVSVTAIVGDNGAGKTTCLDALLSCLVDFDDNCGLLIWEDKEELYYHLSSRCECSVDFGNNCLKRLRGNHILPMNMIYYSDLFCDYNASYILKDNISRVNSYVDISNMGELRKIEREKKSLSSMQFFMNDSLKKIMLSEFVDKKNDYPWTQIIKNRELIFQVINWEVMRRKGFSSSNHNRSVLPIVMEWARLKEKSFSEEDIIRETLFFDYVISIYQRVGSVENNNALVDEIIDILFKDYVDDNYREKFLFNIFENYDQNLLYHNENVLQERFKNHNPEIVLPIFEKYLLFYNLLKSKKWLMNSIKESMHSNRLLYKPWQKINAEDRNFIIDVPKEESLIELCTDYIDARFACNILRFYWPMSSGENSIFSLFARVYYAIKNFQDYSTDNDIDSILLIIDEIDNTYHPKWQQRILNWLINFTNQMYPYYKFQLIIATHSPILLSDIPKNRVIFMPSGVSDNVIRKEHAETFAANIASLYYDSFFMKEGSIGELAKEAVDSLYMILGNYDKNSSYRTPKSLADVQKNKEVLTRRIKAIFERKNDYYADIGIDEAFSLCLQLINSIGEDIWRIQLKTMFNKYFEFRDDKDATVERIQNMLELYSKEERGYILEMIRNRDDFYN